MEHYSIANIYAKSEMESTNIEKLYACDECAHSFDTGASKNITMHKGEKQYSSEHCHLPHRVFD